MVSPPLVRKPGRPRSAQAEQAALQATLELLASHGVHGFGMETVANTAGVAKTTVYRRWPSKDDLIVDALVHMKGEPAPPPGDSVRGDLLALLRRMRDQPRKNLALRITPRIVAEGECCPQLVAKFRDRVVRPRRAIFAAVLQRGIHSGGIRSDADVELVTDLLWSPPLTCNVSRARVYRDEELEFLVDTVLRGLAPSGRLAP